MSLNDPVSIGKILWAGALVVFGVASAWFTVADDAADAKDMAEKAEEVNQVQSKALTNQESDLRAIKKDIQFNRKVLVKLAQKEGIFVPE